MVKKVIRPGLILSLVGLAILIVGLKLKTNVTAARGNNEVIIESFAGGVSQPQLLRICMGNPGSNSSAGPRESVTFTFIKIQTTFGEVILERSLSVPQGQFRCTDFSHPELVAAGLVPESNTRLQFMVTVGAAQDLTVGAAQTETVGSAETMTTADGKTETYKTIQTRQITVVQDL
jgi:hypothetical protein